jgi:histidine transport system permease protein
MVREPAVLDAFFREGSTARCWPSRSTPAPTPRRSFAGAIRATPYGEIEAGRAYGMSKFTLYRRIILPSALRRSLPYYSNEVILMLHSTTLAFTATVPDLLKVARDVNSATYSSFEAFGIAAVLYA